MNLMFVVEITLRNKSVLLRVIYRDRYGYLTQNKNVFLKRFFCSQYTAEETVRYKK